MPKLYWSVIALLVALSDQFTKMLVMENLQKHVVVEILPFLEFYLTYNPGAAFSFLADSSGWQRWFFVIAAFAAILYMSYLIHKTPEDKKLCLGLTLVIGGAIGNLVDRLLLGAVVDFISIDLGYFYWPAFNLADSFITIGAGVFLWIIMSEKQEKPTDSARLID